MRYEHTFLYNKTSSVFISNWKQLANEWMVELNSLFLYWPGFITEVVGTCCDLRLIDRSKY